MFFKVQVERMVKQTLGIDQPTRSASSYAIDYLDGKVSIYTKEDNVTVKEVVALARWAADNGYTQIVIDSLSMVNLKVIRKDDLNLSEQTFVRMLKEVARSTGLHVHLVVHMRKGENEYKTTDKMDIKGAGEITDLADYVFIIDRNVKKEIELNKPGNEDNEVELKKTDGSLRCIKNRYDPVHRSLPLWFCGKMFSFKKGRRASIPRLIEPSSEDLKRGYESK
jgi:twinkle protein